MSYFLLLLCYTLLNVYIVWQLRFWSKASGLTIKNKVVVRVIWVIYGILTLMPVGGAFLPASRFMYTLQGWGNIYLGILAYSGMILLVIHIIWMISGGLKKTPSVSLGRIAFCAAVIGSLVLNIYGMQHAQSVKVKNYDLTLKQTSDVDQIKIVLLGDLHMSVNSNTGLYERMVEAVNAQNPDVIVIAGDFFTSSYGGLDHPEEYIKVLQGFQAKYGVYASYGNHDVVETLFGGFPVSPIEDAVRPDEMAQFIEDCNIQILMDEMVELADGEIQLVVRTDGERAGDGTDHRLSPEEVLADCDLEKPILVLEHEPLQLSDLAENGADLILSGHTHNGQIFPGNLIIPFFNENAYGLKHVGDADSFVTAGVGFYGPPIRVGTDSEVTVLNVKFNG